MSTRSCVAVCDEGGGRYEISVFTTRNNGISAMERLHRSMRRQLRRVGARKPSPIVRHWILEMRADLWLLEGRRT